MSQAAVVTFRGTVGRVFFSNPETPAMAGVLRLDEGGEVRFAGKVYAQPGDKLEVSGVWGSHPKFGKQFEVQTGVVRMDESPDALVHLLATDKRFVGLGQARARKIVDAALALSADGGLGSALAEHPSEIADRSGVALDIIENAAEVWNSRRSYFDALAALVEQGWSNAQAQSIVHVFGENAATIVRHDPYMLIGKIARFGFRTVDAVARAMGTLSTDPARLIAGVAYCLDKIGDEGHTWTTREGLLSAAIQELRPDTLDGEVKIGEALQTLIVNELVSLAFSPVGTEIVADTRLMKTEVTVFERLMDGLADASLEPIKLDGPRATEILGTLNAGQAAALRGFANFRYGVISGGAGVGKTYTMRAVCEVAEENGMRVLLCAPTGKAAKKLAKATNREAKTIHRTLEPAFDEVSGDFRFKRHAGNQLSCGLLVIDEMSMVDVRLARLLLDAVGPKTRVLIVGDHNQIPSVGAGAILRDILAAHAKFPGAIHVLKEIVRQAGILARNTAAILDGVVSPQQTDVWRSERTERGHEEGAAALCAALVERIVTAPEPLQPFGRVLDLGWDVQVLAPMRKGPLGTYNLNVHLQKLRQRLLGNPPPEAPPEGKAPRPLPGDRVIWTENDYELDLFNGTQALVTGINKDGAMNLFTEDGREVTIPSGKRKNVDVAYAMTIHKSQGSEFPLVIAVISSSHFIMRDRNLLYTCVSRASEAVVIFGDANGVRAFAEHRRSTSRQTFGKFLVHGWSPMPTPMPSPLECGECGSSLPS